MVRTASGTAAYVKNCLQPLVRHLAVTPIPSEDSPGVPDPASAAPLNPQSPEVEAPQNGTGRRLTAAPPVPSVATAPPPTSMGAGGNKPQGGSGGSPRQPAPIPPAAAKPPPTSAPLQQQNSSRPQKRQRTSSVLIIPKEVPGGPDGSNTGNGDGEGPNGSGGGTGAAAGQGAGSGRRAALRRLLGAGGVQSNGQLRTEQQEQQPLGSTRSLTTDGTADSDVAASASGGTRSGTPETTTSAGPVAIALSDGSGADAAPAAACSPLAPSAAAAEPADADAAAAPKPPSAGPTYSSVILGYEVLNEPEGMSWDLRLYHNYMCVCALKQGLAARDTLAACTAVIGFGGPTLCCEAHRIVRVV